MVQLILIALAGFGAQLVDGSLGMGYGVTSASLLLATGLAPAMASASVNFAQLGTTLSSGYSHWKMGNVEWRIVRRLSIPGAIGGVLGATLLSSLSTAAARPLMAWLLFALGIYVALRFAVRPPVAGQGASWALRRRFLTPVGLVGGFINATGGGGWGPVATTTLLSTAPIPPRRAIGSVSTSEFVVTLAASGGFLVGLGLAGIDLGVVIALMAGGVLAAPLAARVAGKMHPVLLGTLVGGFIMFLNSGPALAAIGLNPGPTRGLQAFIIGCWLVLLGFAMRKVLRGRRIVASAAALEGQEATEAVDADRPVQPLSSSAHGEQVAQATAVSNTPEVIDEARS